MLNSEQSSQVQNSLTRIFALPITRSTYREIQNALFRATNGSKEKTQYILELIYKGEKVKDNDLINELLDAFTVKTRLARDVMERGDFVSLLTSDITKPNDKIFLINRIKKVDGEEVQFLTDSDSTLHFIEHFIGRLEEVKSQDKAFTNTYKNRLKQIADDIQKLQK